MSTNVPISRQQAPDPGGLEGAAPSRVAIPESRPRPSGWTRVLWLLAAFTAAVAVGLPLTGEWAIKPVLLLLVPFSLIHGVRRYGAKVLIIFLVETLVVSNFFENFSISTGFPFGHYHYAGGLQLIDVPIQIGPIYFGLGYVCWLVASTLLDEADTVPSLRAGAGRRVSVVALPMLAAAMMTMFDVGMDSISSTVVGNWVWERGGGLFGVPYSNYLGWWLVTYIFFQIFALYLARSQAPVHAEGRGALLQPVVAYGALGLSSVTYFIGASDQFFTDPTGIVWSGHAINESMMIINLFSVVFVAFLATVKLARNDIARSAAPTFR
ncbi:carotenoid biosynthesis protein [Streptomyces sp. NPDC051644]|uniref:carotenoid biosynthesis protein n=1 Tax=Streptomyces sp. NPDC051644 TaxID=3365666 RepID=UPI00379AE5B1